MNKLNNHKQPNSLILMTSSLASALVIAGFIALAMGVIGAANYMAS